jgi:hypothetical protein
MFLVSLQNPTIEAPTLELFAQRADGRRQERFHFGLRLTRPAQGQSSAHADRSAREKAVSDQKWPSLERLVSSRSKASRKRCSAPLAVSALMFILVVIARRIVAKESANSERCSQGASRHRNLKAR